MTFVLSPAAIAGISAGATVGCCCLTALLFFVGTWLWRRRRHDSALVERLQRELRRLKRGGKLAPHDRGLLEASPATTRSPTPSSSPLDVADDDDASSARAEAERAAAARADDARARARAVELEQIAREEASLVKEEVLLLAAEEAELKAEEAAYEAEQLALEARAMARAVGGGVGGGRGYTPTVQPTRISHAKLSPPHSTQQPRPTIPLELPEPPSTLPAPIEHSWQRSPQEASAAAAARRRTWTGNPAVAAVSQALGHANRPPDVVPTIQRAVYRQQNSF